MNFEAALNYFTHHVESIIQWLFLFILALTGFLISRGLLGKKAAEGGGAGPSLAGSEIEAVLKQILERTTKLEGVSVQQMSPETAALAQTQVESLKKELAARDEEVKKMKESGSGDGAKVNDEALKLQARLKELETKLSEYEILEDDIADLSLYKEENVRLRGELEKLKGGGAASAPATEAAAPAATSPDDIVAEFAQAVGVETVVAPPPAADMTMKVPDTGNPMNDFEAAVKIEKQMTGKPAASTESTAAPAPASAPAPTAAAATPAPAASAPAAPAATGEASDLFAEFAQTPEAPIDGALDTDKMMQEMAALVSLEPHQGGSSVDDHAIDTEKMAAEAGTFHKS